MNTTTPYAQLTHAERARAWAMQTARELAGEPEALPSGFEDWVKTGQPEPPDPAAGLVTTPYTIANLLARAAWRRVG